MAQNSLQGLPRDIILDILDCLDHKALVPLAATCRVLREASETFLRQHSVINLVNNNNNDNSYGIFSLGDAFKLLACNRWIARNIRKIEVKHPLDTVLTSRDITDGIIHCLRRAARCPKGTDESVKRIIGFDAQTSRRLLFISLLCENLESLSITAKRLNWLEAAEHLNYRLWPHSRLEDLEITWDDHQSAGIWTRKHDLQDIWLLLSTSTLKSVILDGLQQDNNLHAGLSDRAAIRTTYWPIPLEMWTLYQYNLEGAWAGVGHDKRDPPGPLPSSPFEHGFEALERFAVRNFSAPGTWLPSMVSCFTSLRLLTIVYDDDKMNWDDKLCMTFQLLNAALLPLAATLEYVTISVAVRIGWPIWIQVTQHGYFSIGSLHKMLRLQFLEVPWYAWLLRGKSGGLPDFKEIGLPSGLEILVLGQCDAINSATIKQLVEATVSSQGSHYLKRIILRVQDELAFKVDEFSDLATEIEIVPEK